jgi:hypothetical protein
MSFYSYVVLGITFTVQTLDGFSDVLPVRVPVCWCSYYIRRCCPPWRECCINVSNIGLLWTVSLSFIWFPFLVSVSVKFLEGIKHLSFPHEVNCVHYVFQWAESVAVVNDMLVKRRSVCVFKIVIMFAEPYMGRTTGLTCAYFVACEILKLVNSIFLLFVGLWGILWFLGVFLAEQIKYLRRLLGITKLDKEKN